MKKELLNYLCCPISHDDLQLLDPIINKNGEILKGKLVSGNLLEFPIEMVSLT